MANAAGVVRLGVNVPYDLIGDDRELYRAYARRAEELGFTHLVALDHVLGPEHARRDPPLDGPYTEQTPFREPLVLLTWLGAQTSTIELTTGILVLPQRQTALVAKQVAEMQLLTGGRLRLGIGSGWNWVEYDALGVSYRRRGARLADQVGVMRTLWTGAVVDVDTEFHRIDRAAMIPAPPPIPIWFGGYSLAQQDRCLQFGDGFIFSRYSSFSVKTVPEMIARAQAGGRDPGSLGFEAGIDHDEQMLGRLHTWTAAGGTHAYIRMQESGWALMDELEQVARLLGLSQGAA